MKLSKSFRTSCCLRANNTKILSLLTIPLTAGRALALSLRWPLKAKGNCGWGEAEGTPVPGACRKLQSSRETQQPWLTPSFRTRMEPILGKHCALGHPVPPCVLHTSRYSGCQEYSSKYMASLRKSQEEMVTHVPCGGTASVYRSSAQAQTANCSQWLMFWGPLPRAENSGSILGIYVHPTG